MKQLFRLLLLTGVLTLSFACQTNTESSFPKETDRTLAIIKPNAIAHNQIGEIIARLEKGNLRIAAAKMLHLTPKQAQEFYNVHRERPFFQELVAFMTSGPVMILVLEGEDAITKNREIMGATDPKKAAPGTIRADFGKSVTENAIHGSDAPETAKKEIAFFFQPKEIVDRFNK